jgi:hypothetical protein
MFNKKTNINIAVKRLFVPLATSPFEWFSTGKKGWELRKLKGQYNDKNVFEGKITELRKGYRKGSSLWGVIKKVVKGTSLSDIFRQIPFQEIMPLANNEEEAKKDAAMILGISIEEDIELMAFKVNLGLTRIELSEEYLSAIISGQKISTIRKGIRDIPSGPAIIDCNQSIIPISIIKTKVVTMESLSMNDTRDDGFDSINELKQALLRFYPNLYPSQPLTKIEFHLQGRE